MSTFSTRTKIAAIAIAAGAVLAVSGCSNNDSGMNMPGMSSGATSSASQSQSSQSQPSPAAAYNDADVTFLQSMYPHHAQAIEMAKLVPTRSQNQQILELAANIEKAQGPEMDQITALLQQFGKPAPSADMGDTGDMGGMTGMPGMMSPQQMSSLMVLSGSEFDKMWLTMMTDHHAGAIEMSDKELADGTNAESKKLAESIKSAQQAEIGQMKTLLNQN